MVTIPYSKVMLCHDSCLDLISTSFPCDSMAHQIPLNVLIESVKSEHPLLYVMLNVP